MGGISSSNLILVSGLSGSGKSTALGALEDLGYYCADNLPAALLAEFANHIRSNPSLYQRVALGVDARSHGSALSAIPGWMDDLNAEGANCELLFLTAEQSVLLQRFSETRRRHPLTTEKNALPAAIKQEEKLLEPLRECADWVINTSQTNIHQLRQQIWKWAGRRGDVMTLVLQSFAFKLGVPQDADFIFDARCLPNPHWEEDLRTRSGQDSEVREWLEKEASAREMLNDIRAFLSSWLPRFQDAQRSYVTVGIGCTGGRHRSVYLVEELRNALVNAYPQVVINHRDLPA